MPEDPRETEHVLSRQFHSRDAGLLGHTGFLIWKKIWSNPPQADGVQAIAGQSCRDLTIRIFAFLGMTLNPKKRGECLHLANLFAYTDHVVGPYLGRIFRLNLTYDPYYRPNYFP